MRNLYLLAVLLGVLAVVQANVIGIDFASDSIKVAIVQPGTPLEIVSNFQSKRKTPTCVTFYRGERMFGADSYALMSRKPELTYSRIFRMMGRTPEHPLMKEFKDQYFPYTIYANDTTSATSLKMEETHYHPEELMAMILQHVKDMTQAFGGKVIKDCVITVPSSFTQHEREAVFTAADIADLKVLTLIEENTAAALHYGLDRTFETPSNVVYFNMGSGSIQVTIVTHSSYTSKEGGKNKTVGQFEVLGKGWDSSLGGFNFDVRLAELLADRFNVVWGKKGGKGKDLRDYPLPMTKLRLQAGKVKEILSANNEFPVSAEQLHEDTDLRTKVSRADFEAACEDLFARITLPIDQALLNANLTASDITAVEMLGGGVRMPRVKKILDSYFEEATKDSVSEDGTPSVVEVGQHLNGDEAMALGAAFRAANISTAFRVRKLGASDISSFGINVRLDTLETEAKAGLFGGIFGGAAAAAETAWTKFTSLYPAKSTLSSKTKTVAFQYGQDISCKIQYDTEAAEGGIPLPQGTSPNIAAYNITGVAAFARENDAGLGTPKVHLSFGLDSSGIVSLLKAEATLELPEEKEVEEVEAEAETDSAADAADTDATDAADGTGDADTTDAAEGAEEGEKEGEKETPETETEVKEKGEKGKEGKDSKEKEGKEGKGGKKSKAKKEKAKKPKRDRFIRKTLTVSQDLSYASPRKWTPEMVAEARARLGELNKKDELRQATEAALNELEGYIYKVKNSISDREDELALVSTDEQRTEVVAMADAAEEWLYDEGRGQSIAVYADKQASIREAAEAIFTRATELPLRKETVAKATKLLKTLKDKVGLWDVKMPQVTPEETEKLLKAVRKAEEWIATKQAAQAELSDFEMPSFLSAEVTAQLKPVSALFEKLLSKPKPAPPVLKKNETEANSTTSTNGTTNGTDANTTVNATVNVNGTDAADAADAAADTVDVGADAEGSVKVEVEAEAGEGGEL